MAKKPRIPHKFHPWINARKQFRLSDAHIQMARELGLSPKRFAKYADRENQPWKLPLTEFIETQYRKQFGKDRPDEVKTMEEIAAAHVAKRAARKLANAKKAKESASSVSVTSAPAVAGNDSETSTTYDAAHNSASPITSQVAANAKPNPQTTTDAEKADNSEVTQARTETATLKNPTAGTDTPPQSSSRIEQE